TPNINMKVGAVYTFNIDSIQTNGTITPTRYKSTHTYLTQGTFYDSANAFQVRTVTQDSIGGPQAIDTFYVRYNAGKFYQYGIIQLIDPSATPTWNLIADFTVSQGTQWTIASNVPITIIPGGTVTIKSKVAADTAFQTFGWGNNNINCYRAEVTGDIYLATSYLGTVYVDYFIGDADPVTNPSGLVRLRLRPINITVYQAAGADQKLQHWTIP
ncbi:MAG TPA: hypothetical protein VGK25_01640, partial [Ignavibacteria bacterium]